MTVHGRATARSLMEACPRAQGPASPDRRATTHTGSAFEVRVGRWTLRWARDQWMVGIWRGGAVRNRWRDCTWHRRLDQALRRLLDRLVADESSEASSLEDLVLRVESVSDRLADEIRRMVSPRDDLS